MPDSTFAAATAPQLGAEDSFLPSTLPRLVDRALRALGGHHAGVIITPSSTRFTTIHASSPAVHHSHELQYELGQGPCLDAIGAPEPVYLSGDLAVDSRWPTWGPAVSSLGLRSLISVRLASTYRRYGSLNLYSHDLDPWDDSVVDTARAYARRISATLARFRTDKELFGLP